MSSRVRIPNSQVKARSGDTRLSASPGEETGESQGFSSQLDIIATVNSAKAQAAGSRGDPALEAKVRAAEKIPNVPFWPSCVHVWSESSVHMCAHKPQLHCTAELKYFLFTCSIDTFPS